MKISIKITVVGELASASPKMRTTFHYYLYITLCKYSYINFLWIFFNKKNFTRIPSQRMMTTRIRTRTRTRRRTRRIRTRRTRRRGMRRRARRKKRKRNKLPTIDIDGS